MSSSPAGSVTTSVSYTYNANGEMTSNGQLQFIFDPENRLSSVAIGNTDTSATKRYAHNALGQRVFKTEPLYPDVQGEPEDAGFWASLAAFFGRFWNPFTQQPEQLGFAYVYDEEGTLIGEYGSGGAQSVGSSQYIWLPTSNGPMPIAAVINGSKFAVHADHLNTPRRLTDDQGQAAWQWRYSAFGDEQPTKAANRFLDLNVNPNPGAGVVADVNFNLRYPGQYADQESGLHYNYFRSYDARTGRYTQSDPIGLDGGWNRFGYVAGDPLRYIDREGKFMTPGGWMFVGGLAYGAFELYQKYKAINEEMEQCKRRCENIVACGDLERTGMLDINQARCMTTCRGFSLLDIFSGAGKGPMGPTSPDRTPDYFDGRLAPGSGRK